MVVCWVQLLLASSICTQSREVFTLRHGWKFALGHHPKSVNTNFDDRDWDQIVAPHDWAIDQDFMADGDTAKLPWKNESWYRIKLPLVKFDSNKPVLYI